VIVLHTRIRRAREEAGYTREQFAELLDVSVSYMAEVERGRTGVSVKTLIKICSLLGLSSDYVLFGTKRDTDTQLLDKIHRLDKKYLPLVDKLITELLAIDAQNTGP
jgi:transcriptional regulator with XRE-family HTH domain